MNSAKPFGGPIATKLWTCLLRNFFLLAGVGPDLLIAQSHGVLQQYVEDMQLMTRHALAAWMSDPLVENNGIADGL